MVERLPLLVIAAAIFVFAGFMVFFPAAAWRMSHALAFKNPDDVEPSNLSILGQIISGLTIMIMVGVGAFVLLDDDGNDHDGPSESETLDYQSARIEWLFGTTEVQVVPLPEAASTEGDAEFQLAPHYRIASDEQNIALLNSGVIASAVEADIWVVAQAGAAAVQVEETDQEVRILTFASCQTSVDPGSACQEPTHVDFVPDGPEWYGSILRLTPIVLDSDLDGRLVIDAYSGDEVTLP